MKNLIQLSAKTEAAAKSEAAKLSQQKPGKYITIVNAFGLFAVVRKSLNVFAPSDSVFGWYALNGKVKPFTGKQIIADQRATPTLA